MTRINTTFGIGNPTWANACVGNNGFPGYWEYAKGFSQAANLLIGIVLQNQGVKYSVDELVYPVCFNMRHSVELRLKGSISELMALEQCKGRRLEFDLAGSHDIGNIWQFFAQKSASMDDRYLVINTQLEAKIVDLAEIDATGQTFRYPLDTESQKHLVDIEVINFLKLAQSFSELEKTLDKLHILNSYLREEYSFGTFTKQLSRKNIFEIAPRLPERARWKEESFDEIKKEIKKHFNIGSKELSTSIKIIEAHYELAPMIGLSIQLLGVVEADIIGFADLWVKLHEIPSDSDPIDYETKEWGTEALFASSAQTAEIRRKVWESVSPKLTAEILAGISALFYFADILDFSERYAQLYEIELKKAKTAFENSCEDVRLKFFHIFDKTNGMYNILRSLYFLNKREIGDELVTVHGLDSKFSWLDDARSRDLFKKPRHCGYAI